MKIEFKEIGRNKKSWTKEFSKTVSESEIAREAKRNGGIMSSDVDAEFDDSGSAGSIFVGGWREVGKFVVSA